MDHLRGKGLNTRSTLRLRCQPGQPQMALAPIVMSQMFRSGCFPKLLNFTAVWAFIDGDC